MSGVGCVVDEVNLSGDRAEVEKPSADNSSAQGLFASTLPPKAPIKPNEPAKKKAKHVTPCKSTVTKREEAARTFGSRPLWVSSLMSGGASFQSVSTIENSPQSVTVTASSPASYTIIIADEQLSAGTGTGM